MLDSTTITVRDSSGNHTELSLGITCPWFDGNSWADPIEGQKFRFGYYVTEAGTFIYPRENITRTFKNERGDLQSLLWRVRKQGSECDMVPEEEPIGTQREFVFVLTVKGARLEQCVLHGRSVSLAL
jgi:hypothetical protein